MQESEDRWAIYIDIQGFGQSWKKDDAGLKALCELMRAIFIVGTRVFPNEPDRLFAHQFGDGFIITSSFAEESLERCVTIAIALLQHIAAATRCFAKAAIVEGGMQGINGCYPEEVMKHSDNNFNVSMGEGVMTVIPVMGSALIRGVGLDKKYPRGPLLVVEKEKIKRLPPELLQNDMEGDLVSINWITYQSQLLSVIQQKSNLAKPTKIEMEENLQRYCKAQKQIPLEWIQNVNKYLLYGS